MNLMNKLLQMVKLLSFLLFLVTFVAYTLHLQSQVNYLDQIKKIKQNWRGPEIFDICFCLIFDRCYKVLF